MLNPFPDLLVYGILAPLVIRLAVGAALLYLSVEHFRNRKDIAALLSPMVGRFSRGAGFYFAVVEAFAGALLVAGAWTQIAALVAIVLAVKSLLLRSRLSPLAPFSRSTYLLIIAMSASLLLSGAGALAFDLPL